uniref:Chemokine (C-C motif) receptor 2 n=1 Tax=Tetraodon nigroviridis TaxID=99883 RepID=H3BWS8_TETNG
MHNKGAVFWKGVHTHPLLSGFHCGICRKRSGSLCPAGQWPFGDFMCPLPSKLLRGTLVMIFMTLDRYMVIMHAITVARYRTLRAGIFVTMVLWLLSFSVSLPTFIFTEVTNESYGSSCYYAPEKDSWQIYDLFVINVLGLMLPLVVMIVCYSRIIPRLVNMRSTKRHRVIKLIISIMLTFFLFWAPYNFYFFLKFLHRKGKLVGDPCQIEEHLGLTGILTETFAYTHCCLNPIIYAFMGEKFMKRVLIFLRHCFPSLHFVSFLSRDLSMTSRRRSSVMSRSSEVSSTFIS